MPCIPRNLRIRTRISLWIFAVSTGLLVLMSATVYAVFDRQLAASLDDTLRLQAGTNLEFPDTSSSPPSLVRTNDTEEKRTAGEAVLRLYGGDGRMLVDASPASGISVAEREVVSAALTANRDISRTIDLSHDEDYRVVANPVTIGGVVVAVLVTGIEQSQVTKPLTVLRLILLVAVPMTAAALGLGGYLIARRVLWPVAAMTDTAREITRGDLRRRQGSQPETGKRPATRRGRPTNRVLRSGHSGAPFLPASSPASVRGGSFDGLQSHPGRRPPGNAAARPVGGADGR